MRIAYTTTFDAQNIHKWSGTPYYMSQAFAKEGLEIEYIGSLKRHLPLFFKLRQIWSKHISGQRESPRFNIHAAQQYSWQVAKKLATVSCDAILSPLVNPIAYLDCKQPIILWTDALYAQLLGFYSPFSTHSSRTTRAGNQITSACLERTKLAIFSSEWAANCAIQVYGAHKDKVKVVPFGANIPHHPSLEEIRALIKKRQQPTIKLLFLAKSWTRKGGNVVLEVTKALHQAGHQVELNIIGYTSQQIRQKLAQNNSGDQPLPSYINCLGFISKHSSEGQEKIKQLLAQTHFLFVPSRAEAYGIVFCEANAFGVPCLTTYVGGITTIVKDNINGMTFSLNATVNEYCQYIVNTMQDFSQYSALALSSYHEFVTRLNWASSVNKVRAYIKEM